MTRKSVSYGRASAETHGHGVRSKIPKTQVPSMIENTSYDATDSRGFIGRIIQRRKWRIAAGAALGLAAAVTGTRLLKSMLFRVQPNDPVVYLAVAGLLGMVALVASYVPARRASKIDPLAAIRQE